MSNLIITVISIALVAVAALMGTYYGGSAFMEGQAKAQANSFIAGAQQVAAAWQMYAVNNGGSFTLTDADWTDGTSTDLVPNYLTQLPSYSSSTLHTVFGLSPPFYFSAATIASNTIVFNSANGNAIYFRGVPEATCKQINFIATGTASIDLNTTWAGYTDTTAAMADLKPFRCVTVLGGTPAEMYFYYRVF